MTKPNVTNISPRFSSNIRQQTPLTFGQNGFGADISSILAPRFVLPLPVFAVLATEYRLLAPLIRPRLISDGVLYAALVT